MPDIDDCFLKDVAPVTKVSDAQALELIRSIVLGIAFEACPMEEQVKDRIARIDSLGRLLELRNLLILLWILEVNQIMLKVFGHAHDLKYAVNIAFEVVVLLTGL